MQLRYDDDFVEGAVFIRANSRRSPGVPALQLRRFHAEREKLYLILDPDERNTAFFKLHLDWFREWGLERRLLEVANEYPRLRSALSALVFRKARVKNDEGAELYVNSENGRAGVVALRVERFEQLNELALLLRHEFTHLDDMVNPAFGYSLQFVLEGRNAAQQRLTRERYRLLWDITIDGRLAHSSKERNEKLDHLRTGHRTAFDRAFGFWPDTRRDEVFDSLWNDPNPRHEQLLAIASDPRGLKSTHEPTPGAPCPLCGFATFVWANTSAITDQTKAAIREEFPDWTTNQGACGRCAEIYRLIGTAAYATLLAPPVVPA
jgi:hypothetical protein